MKAAGAEMGTQLKGRYYPTAKAYEALGLPVPGTKPSWWRRLLGRAS